MSPSLIIILVLLTVVVGLSTLCAGLLWREYKRRGAFGGHGDRKLRTLIDAVPVLIAYVDSEERLRASNRAHSQWFGHAPDEIIGRPVKELLGDAEYNGVRRQIGHALAGKQTRFEGPLRNARGQTRYVERTYTPSVNDEGEVEGYFICVNDLTERKEREEANLRSKRDIAEIVESLQEGFALFDEEDRLVVNNEKYARIFPTVADLIKPGVKFEELITAAAERGQNIEAKETWIQSRLEAHARPRGRFQHRFTDGRWIWVEEHKTHDNRTLSTYIDITQLKQREVELELARDHAEAADATKSEFLASVSHELRTPLNAIMGFSEVMAKEMFGPVSERYLEYVKDINDSGTHLLHVVDMLLDISKVEAGELKLTETSIVVADLAEACIRLIQGQADASDVALSSKVDENLPWLWADEVRLKQIVINLLSNAVKFTEEGGSVSLEAGLDKDGALQIRVVDTGIGMDEEELARAMEPFGQAGSAYTRTHEGTGLGLPISKSLVELHGGTLTITSAKDVGTQAVVKLPVSRLQEQQEPMLDSA